LEDEYTLDAISPQQRAEHERKLAQARQQEQQRHQTAALAGALAGHDALARGDQLLAAGRPHEAATAFELAALAYFQQIRQSAADARFWRDHYLGDLKARYDERLAEIERAWQEAEQAVAGQVHDLRSAFSWAILPWNDPIWEGYDPPAVATTPSLVRVGHLDLPDAIFLDDVPALIPFVGQGHLFLSGDDVVAVRQLLQTILLRLIVANRPRTVQLTLIDGAGSGVHLAGFLRLPPTLRGAKVFARPEEIAPQLDQIITHIETVIQQRLTNLYSTIEEYNAEEGKVPVPYHILAIADLPAGCNETILQKLLVITRTGPRAGVYLAASLNPGFPYPQRFDPQDLLSQGALLRLDGNGRLSWEDPDYGSYSVIPDPSPDPFYSNAWMDRISAAAELPQVTTTFDDLVIPERERWRGSAVASLRVPIGVSGTGERHDLELGKGTVNFALIGGMTQSGKSNLLHVLITQLALRYSPDELELYLLDFKEGVEFADYARIRIPHVRVLALHSEREFGLSILRRLQEILEERGQIFKQVAVTRYDDYRRVVDRPLPRLVAILDEYQVLFQEDDALAREAERLLEDLTRRGAAFGLHILLSTQSPARGRVLSAATYDQIGLRIALKCYPDVARAILGEGNHGADQLANPGDAIYNAAMGHPSGNQFVHIAFLAPSERPGYLSAIAALGHGRNAPPPVTFDPDAPADLADNHELQAALAAPPLPAGSPARIWLGEPVEIKPPTAAEIERYTAANLLLMADEEAAAYGLLAAAVVSLAAQRAPQDAEFVLADFTRPTSPLANWHARLTQALPQARLTIVGPRQATEALNALTESLAARQADPTALWPDVYLLVAGLNRWRELRPVQERFGPRPSEAAQKLALLASEGPDYGIHLIVWTDDLAPFYQTFDRSGLNLFDLRAALHLSEADSNALFGNAAAASRIEGNRAVYRHESWKSGRVEKFKPYPLPDAETLQKLVRR